MTDDARTARAYSYAEASRILGVPASTLRRWHGGTMPGLSFDALVRMWAFAHARRDHLKRPPRRLVAHSAIKANGVIDTHAALATIDGQVSTDPLMQFGSPCLAGTRITTSILADRRRSGESIESLAADYDVSAERVIAALRFEGVEP